MKNYNPINANTLLFECLELEEFQTLRNFCLNNTKSISTTDVIIGDSNYSISVRLLTNYPHLEKFWKLNFKSSESNSTLHDGEIIFFENHNNDRVLKKYDFEKYRYYNKDLNSIISLNNDFYGNVKISYRAICANAVIKNDILTLHSGCLRIQNKNIALTGDSGAGKSTLFNLLDKHFDGILIWEDFGFINSTNSQIIVPNEIFNQLNHRTVKSMFPSFEENSEIFYSEFFKKDNPFYKERRLMVDFSEYRKTIQNTPINFSTVLDALIIITNDIDLPFSIKRVSADEAIKIFSKLNFSKAHQTNIRYANGSLILSEEQNEIYYQTFLALFKVIKNLIILNNVYTPINPNEIIDLINEN
jgi:hypothetical protein